jgi:hypothetical protein
MIATANSRPEAAKVTLDFIVNVLGKTNDLNIVLKKFDRLLTEYSQLEVENGYFEYVFCMMEREGRVSRNDLFKLLFLLKEADADDSYEAMLFNYEKLREKELVADSETF